MQMSAPAPLLLMSVVCVVLSQSRSTCPKNQVLHSNGRCCQYVRCHPRKYITLLLSAFIMIINRLIDWLGSLIKIIFLIVMYCIVATIEKRGADRGSDFFTVYFLHWINLFLFQSIMWESVTRRVGPMCVSPAALMLTWTTPPTVTLRSTV